MQISDYMSDARSVALYLEKDPSSTFTYPSLGIADEVGELVDKISPELYDRLISNKEIAKEMGDVLWYINNTALDIGVSFCDIMSDIADGHLIHSFSDVYLSLRASKDQRPTMMKLAIYSGRIAGVAKKMIRDPSGECGHGRGHRTPPPRSTWRRFLRRSPDGPGPPRPCGRGSSRDGSVGREARRRGGRAHRHSRHHRTASVLDSRVPRP